MAYNYGSGYGGPAAGAGLASAYSSRLAAAHDPYHPDQSLLGTSRFLSSESETAKASIYAAQAEIASSGVYPSGKIAGAAAYSQAAWGGVDVLGSMSSLDPTLVPGVKRSADALYQQALLGTHKSIGQSEALFSTNSLAKRLRLETASILPIYPQRPGEKDCTYYMLTRTCKFGASCKFDHPSWVPEGGIPGWKEVPLAPTSESLPERPGEPDCPHYLKTQKCKFGSKCKFNHPKDKANASAGTDEGAEYSDNSVLPERPTEPICSFYSKTGKCKFGAICKFDHPKDIQVLSDRQENGAASGDSKPEKTFVPFTPALMHNSKGLPIRPGETDCLFYLKTGSCKYGAMCCFNHPDRSVSVAVGQTMIPAATSNLPIGGLNPMASLIPNIDPHITQTSFAMGTTIYPQRPGEIECDFYMKTGQCKFGERCKFHHPIDRSLPSSTAKKAVQQNVKLTLAGLPRREGAVACAYYMKTGACKFSAACRFDHPPPGEAVAMATSQGSAAYATGGEEKAAAETSDQQL